jgi:hypothetical protein
MADSKHLSSDEEISSGSAAEEQRDKGTPEKEHPSARRRARGRPAKAGEIADEAKDVPPVKKRGRPPKTAGTKELEEE